jgi:hypothetical protein
VPRLGSIRTPAPTALLLVVLLLAGCAAPDRGAARTPAAPAVLYVANSLDGTVTRLDARSGRALGPAVPVETAPFQVVAGAGGGVLVLGQGAGRGAELHQLVDAAGSRGAGNTPVARPVARPVALPPAPPAAHATALAGDGDRHAVLVYAPPGAGTPHLALVDVATGLVASTQRLPPAAAADAAVRSVAVEGGPAGPVAYVGLWRWAAGGDESGRSVAGWGLILALHAETGTVVGSVRLDGAPMHLLLAPAPGQAGHRLYAVQQVPGPARGAGADAPLAPRTWELVTVHPTTLDVERTAPLDGELVALASAPDGGHLYGLARHHAVATGAATTPLLRLDPANGAARALVHLPGVALSLVVTGDRVYAPSAFGAEVWTIDRRSGRLLETIPVGRHPLGIALGGAHPGAL